MRPAEHALRLLRLEQLALDEEAQYVPAERLRQRIRRVRRASAAYGAYFVEWHNASDLEGLRAWVRVLAATGQTRSALAKAEQAVRLAPGEAATHADLATLQAAAGDLPAALTSARRALAISPADAAIQGLVERLAGGAGEAEGAEPVP